MNTRKYISEFGLNMCTGYRLLLQQDQLHKVAELEFDPHIYIIGRRPRITIDPTSVKITDDRVSGRFLKQVKSEFISIPFDVQNYLGTSDVTFQSEYPFTEFAFVDKAGEILSCGKCALQLAACGYEYWNHLDLEVLYIGQSYGKDGARNAADRLANHSTLQGIYAEAIRNAPDQDVWMVLCSFEEYLLASFDGRSKNYATSEPEDNAHIKQVLSTPITEQQKINFTEAALIRYFQPEYNKIYKESFPNPAHSTYSECYDVDLNMVCVEVQTEDLGLRLWSEAAKPEWVHFCKFPLHSREERQFMFDVL